MTQEKYAAAYRAFEPAADDNPEAIPYYRAAAGLRAAWGIEFCDKYHHIFHGCFCAAGGAPVADGLRIAQETLREMARTTTYPKKPEHGFFASYRARPAEPTEADARALFNEEYRRAFPGRRANSKHANDLRRSKLGIAMDIVRARHGDAMSRYHDEMEKDEATLQRRLSEWREQCAAVDAFVAAAKRILEEYP